MEPPPLTLLQIRLQLMELGRALVERGEQIQELAMRIPVPDADQLPPAEDS